MTDNHFLIRVHPASRNHSISLEIEPEPQPEPFVISFKKNMLDLDQDGPRKSSIRMLGLHLGYGNPEGGGRSFLSGDDSEVK